MDRKNKQKWQAKKKKKNVKMRTRMEKCQKQSEFKNE